MVLLLRYVGEGKRPRLEVTANHFARLVRAIPGQVIPTPCHPEQLLRLAADRNPQEKVYLNGLAWRQSNPYASPDWESPYQNLKTLSRSDIESGP